MPPILALFLSGCGHKPHTEGSAHTGGGVTLSSQPADVNSTLDLALKLATEPNPKKNIFVQFLKAASAPKRLSPKIKVFHIFPNLDQTGGGESVRYFSPELQAYLHNQVIRVSTGDCPRPSWEKHADASVSELNLNATICFSIGNLARLAPSELLRQILSLVLHEASHMGGADEPEAIAWQKAFSSYFGERFGDITSDTDSLNTFKILSEVQVLLGQAMARAKVDPKSPHIYTLVGKVVDKLADLPDFDDPLALELKTHPKRPDLIGNYTNSVLALIDDIDNTFEFSPVLKVKFVRVPIDLPPLMVLKTLERIKFSVDQITEDFLAFTEGDPAHRSTCALPREEVKVPGKPDAVFKQQSYGLLESCIGASSY